jgi:two-component sensor histidine kinase/AmiR/NasT family two-component response regulator
MSGTLRRLLNIDDDEGLCRVVKKEFERHGFTVDMALTGEAGLAMAQQTDYDAIILDHHMPGQDGIDVLMEIGKLPDPPPVVYVTGEAEGRIAVAALKAGATDYVIKEASVDFLPLLRAAVLGAIEQCEGRHARATAEADLRASRDRFENLAAEREVLIHEINHRIGNSLQLVSAFLRLQVSNAHNDDAKAALSNAMARIGAIGSVHRQLYAGGDIRTIDLGRYLENLAEDLRRAIGPATASVDLSVKADSLSTSTDRAVSIGMVVTELVLNAVKYAYAPGKAGAVRVSCRQDGAGVLELVVEDDGRGIEPGAPAQGGGLGSRIIGMMVTKLQAVIERDESHKGVRTVVKIPAPEIVA